MLSNLNPMVFALGAITACLGLIAGVAFLVSSLTKFRKAPRYRLCLVDLGPHEFGLNMVGLGSSDDFDELKLRAKKDLAKRPRELYHRYSYDVTDTRNYNSHHTVAHS